MPRKVISLVFLGLRLSLSTLLTNHLMTDPPRASAFGRIVESSAWLL
jgi:hypothetical protein